MAKRLSPAVSKWRKANRFVLAETGGGWSALTKTIRGGTEILISSECRAPSKLSDPVAVGFYHEGNPRPDCYIDVAGGLKQLTFEFIG